MVTIFAVNEAMSEAARLPHGDSCMGGNSSPSNLDDATEKCANDGFLSLWRRYVDLPADEAARQSLWEEEERCAASYDATHTNESDSPNTQSDQGSHRGNRTWGEWREAWGIPSDVTWPESAEPGVLPQSDFRNCR